MGASVRFIKGEGQRYRSLLTRDDGVVVDFDGGSYNKVGGPAGRVPHDVAHLVVEDAFGLADGVWGVLAAGGLFRATTVVSGRQRPHATQRGLDLARRGHAGIMRAELYTRVVSDLALAGRSGDLDALKAGVAAGLWIEGLTAEILRTTCAALRSAGEAWAALAPGEELSFAWRLRPVVARR